MSDEIRSLVDRRWAEYGIEADAEGSNGRPTGAVARCGNCYVVDAGTEARLNPL